MTAELDELVTEQSKRIRVQTEPENSLLDIMSAPFKGYYNAAKDMLQGVRDALGDENNIKSISKYLAGIVTSSPLYLFMHESIHAASMKLVGGTTDTIHMSKYYGGKLISKLIPWVESTESGPIGYHFGKYPKDVTALETMMVNLSPHLLVIPGYYLLKKGLEEKSPFLTAAGTACIVPLLRHAYMALSQNADLYNGMQELLVDKDLSTAAAVVGAGILLYGSKKVADGVPNFKLGNVTTAASALTAVIGLIVFTNPGSSNRPYVELPPAEEISYQKDPNDSLVLQTQQYDGRDGTNSYVLRKVKPIKEIANK